MAPKKAQKMSLNEFLGDSALGSWADEMDALPTAPSGRADDSRGGLSGRRDDYLSSRPDRSGPPREDLPLPTEPPYTAFIGNLPFDLTDGDLEDYFAGQATKSVKIIKDRDDRPKGFGYIEFAELDGLKEALAKSGTTLAGRTIRVSVAEPPKERAGFGGGFDDDAKFAGPWRREGPLPDVPERDGSRRRFEGAPGPGAREPPPSSVSDSISDWRSSQPTRRAAPPPDAGAEGAGFRRRGPGFRDEERATGPADTEEKWTIGGKFKPSAQEPPAGRFGGARRGDMGPPRDAQSPPEEDTWRKARPLSRNSTSPSNSTPPTPQLARRKLELLPRSNATSTVPSPLSSPNPSGAPAPRSNPFGAAKPVDVTAREQAVTERLEKDREAIHERVQQHAMSRTSSRTASQRPIPRSTPPASVVGSPKSPHAEPAAAPKAAGVAAVVRPSFSFAKAAAGKKSEAGEDEDGADVQEVTEKIDEVQI